MIIQIIADSPISDIERIDRALPIIALDGAIYRLLEQNIVPEYLIGDFDAVDDAVLAKARDMGTQVIHEQDQNSNDLEKGITLAISLGATDIKIFQALGARTDHTLHNLGLLKKFHPLKLSIINQDETIIYAENTELTLKGPLGKPVAIMGFPEASVTSLGLEYDMESLRLSIGGIQSSSNSMRTAAAAVRVERGVVLIYDSTLVVSLHLKIPSL